MADEAAKERLFSAEKCRSATDDVLLSSRIAQRTVRVIFEHDGRDLFSSRTALM
jgi:hypothetical protein